MADFFVETRHLKKYFKTPKGMLHAVDDVDITIEKGKTIGVVGESGCGKSTLGRVVLNLLEPTSGEVLIDGQDMRRLRGAEAKSMRMRAQMIFQDPYSSINPRMSVSEIIAEPIIANRLLTGKKEIQKRVEYLMETVGLAQRFINSYPHELDGGRRQRIGVARALAVNPDFIVCDEPVSALDVSIQAQILNLMMDLQESLGLTYMFITHDLSVVKHISDEIAVMYLGQCVERVSSKELFTKPMHPYTQALLSAIPIPDLSRRGRPRQILRGEVRSPIAPPDGCRFAPRCPYVTEDCKGRNFLLKEVEVGHFVACRKYAE